MLNKEAEHIRGYGKEWEAWITYFRGKAIGGDSTMLGITTKVDCWNEVEEKVTGDEEDRILRS